MMEKKHLFEKLNALLADVSSFAVAVSGGADSLCLAYAAAEWAQANNKKCIALTVDHGLRLESTKEAKQVALWMQEKGILHETLVWEGNKPKTRVEEKAREARYALLTDWCHQHGVSTLLLAHHQDDQAETFFLRLARSSGVDGLSAMKEKTTRHGILILRPFLDYSRAEIQSFLKQFYQTTWVEDPSNQNEVYERVRFRQKASFLAELGLTSSVVALTAKRLGRVQEALSCLTKDFIAKHVSFNAVGYVFVEYRTYQELAAELQIRVLADLIVWVSGSNKPLRYSALEKVWAKIPTTMTFAGVQFISSKKGFYICKELSKMADKKEVLANHLTKWGNFEVMINQKGWIGPLRTALRAKGLPARLTATFPALFDEKGLLWVPGLDYMREKADIKGTICFKGMNDGKRKE